MSELSSFRAQAPEPIRIPELPADAPREQVFEFAALCGLSVALLGSSRHDYLRRAATEYMTRWHPEAP